jgi:predicted MPP superfamily phosphohydrolase
MERLYLKIFHFSDIHYSFGNEERDKILQQEVKAYKESILDNLERYSSENRQLMKLVFLTGDLTFKGKKEEFKFIQNEFVEKLIEYIKPDFVFISPGNHDLERKNYEDDTYLSDSVDNALGSSRDKKEYNKILREMINNSVHRSKINKAFENFSSFKEEINNIFNSKVKVQNSLSPFFYFQKINIPKCEDFEINVLNFNSAWQYSPKYNYYGVLFGDHIREASSFINEGAKYKFNITSFHHPYASLDPFSQDNIQDVYGFSNLILNGHVHRWEATTIISSYSDKKSRLQGKTLQLSSRCVADEHENFSFVPGFSVIDATIDMNKIGYEMNISRFAVPQTHELNNGRTFGIDPNYNPLTVKCMYGGITITDTHNEFEMRELEIVNNSREKVYFLTDRIRPYDPEHTLLIDAIKRAIERKKIEVYYYSSIETIYDLLGATKRLAIGCRVIDSPALIRNLTGHRIIIGDDNILLKGKIALNQRGETRITSLVENDRLCTVGYLNLLQNTVSNDLISVLNNKIEKFGQNLCFEYGMFSPEKLIDNASVNRYDKNEMERINSIFENIRS